MARQRIDLIEQTNYVALGGGGFKGDQLTYTNTSNKIIGPLTATPSVAAETSLFPIEGVVQRYTQDYTVRQVTGGSAPGYYVCVSPTSTAPGGGSFAGGANPGTGLESVLASGDVVRLLYPT